MTCQNCHAEISGEVNFCPQCGHHLPSLKRDKPTFDVSVLKKIFSRKEKPIPSTPNTAQAKVELKVANPTEINIEHKKARKWGWGWYILAGLVYTSVGKEYSYLGEQKGILTAFGGIVCIPIYFYLRNKVFDEMSAINTRSFISGFISFLITACLVVALAKIIAPSNSVQNNAKEFNNNGRAKRELKDYQGAIQDFSKAIEINPNYVDAYVNRGLAEDDISDYQGAIRDYSKAIELSPNIAEVYSGRGVAKTKLKDYSGAMQDFNKTVGLNPKYFSVYVCRGFVKSMLSDYQGALQDYNKAIEINPEYAIAYLNRGADKYKHGDKNGACLDWKKAGELGESSAFDFIKEYCNK